MSRKFKLEIITPAGATPARMVTFLDVPAVCGRLTVLANHEPMICSLAEGFVRVREDDEVAEERWEIGQGSMEVTRDDVTLLLREIRPGSTAK
ncbi:FoF1 ATP synthase subunit delta/epsilon [Verrucomicrobiota bacterium]